MRGGSPKALAEVVSSARHAPGTPTPGPVTQPGELQPAPAPRGYGGEGAFPQKDRLGEKLAHWVNTWADSKDSSVVDELIAECRKVGWLR